MSKFAEHLCETVDATPVSERLANSPAIVLERLARGGGATNWFYCSDPRTLAPVVGRLSPGSVVSFYFDGRIDEASDPQSRVEAALASTGECVVAVLMEDGMTLSVDFVTAIEELREFLDGHASKPRVFAGPFPARDNDGRSAIAITLPDLDGLVRSHPH